VPQLVTHFLQFPAVFSDLRLIDLDFPDQTIDSAGGWRFGFSFDDFH
jgi:hypothetical protein